MKRITLAQALPGHRLNLRFDDGVEGTVDLSADVERGVCAIWRDPEVFARFRIDCNGRALVWSDEVDVCADALYLEITGLTATEFWSASKQSPAYA